MSVQDTTFVRSAAELERKYNFSKLLETAKNFETSNEQLIVMKNEMTNILNALIINLRDILDKQSDISLWFYPGIPTTSNEPYISWINPEEHDGDIYYDQDSGYVYQYHHSTTSWVRNESEDLIQAMAITNADIDTTTDHERKVFVVTPTVPYDSGDWWINNDGTLYICQLGRTTGEFDEEDFVIGNRYTPTIATTDGDMITIKHGQVVKMSDSFATFTDLATGGSTTIAGENITTGSIKSSNYISGVSGTALNLSNGTIDSKNFKLDDIGNVDIGGYLTSTRGILTNFQYVGRSNTGNDFGAYNLLGFNIDGYAVCHYADLEFEVNIPEGFTIISAVLSVNHSVVNWSDDHMLLHKGSSKNLKVYKAPNGINTSYSMAYLSEYDFVPIPTNQLTQIADIGTPVNQTTLGKIEALTPVDIKNNLTEGTNKIIIRTSDAVPSISSSFANACKGTGLANATLNIIGYMKIG